MQQLKDDLSRHFKMKDLGKLHYYLEISVHLNESTQTIRLNQSHYLLKILEKYGPTEAKTVFTPADPNVKLLKDDGCSKKVRDIAQVVGVVFKFNAEPTKAHLTAVKCIFRYLKETVNLSLQSSYRR